MKKLLEELPTTYEFDIGDPNEKVIGYLTLDRNKNGWRANYVHKCPYPESGEDVLLSAIYDRKPTIEEALQQLYSAIQKRK